MATFSPPNDFLQGPGPEVEVTRIDFAALKMPEYRGAYAVILDNVLTASECAQLLSLAEQSSGGKPGAGKWERAMVNIGNYQQALYTEIRNCDRIIWDDRSVVAKVWERCRPHVPEVERLADNELILGRGPVKRGEKYLMTRLNERMRFLKYTGGEYFNMHCDGMYITPGGQERSFYTFHLYLNERDEENDLVGGATTFHRDRMGQEYNVDPRTGRVLLFQHRGLEHSGQEVVSGVKYTVRTDLMFKVDTVDE